MSPILSATARQQAPQTSEISLESGVESSSTVAAAQADMGAAPLADLQDPKQDPAQQSVEQQLADLRKEVAGLKAAIEAIAQNETIPAEVRLQAIRAALGAQGPSSQAAVPAASAEVKPAICLAVNGVMRLPPSWAI